MATLEATSSMWMVGALGFLLGAILGCMAAYLLVIRHGRTRQLQQELKELTERFTDYREQVTQHFMHTSELVHEMTQSYRAVYEHLALGAQHLCNEEPEAPGLAAAAAAPAMTDTTDSDYDELAELSSIRNDIDALLGESGRNPAGENRANREDSKPLQH